ncbi:MAG: FecR family protein [Chthoniobacter sp.]|nr:FecR family protein [Chthoniobacter sp.]
MSHRNSPAFLAASLVLVLAGSAWAGTPYTQATVTRTENKVSYGTIKGDRSDTRPAEPQDVVKAMNFLLSESDSRAELKYDDGTIVRIGQNTIFSFEANSRTLNLKKGTFVFFIPKGQGGGTIKTPSLTAAITGTVGKVSDNIIAILEGEVVLKPSGDVVHAGEFARRNPDGTITIAKFDPLKMFDGKLMTFNGPLPGIPEAMLGLPLLDMKDLGDIESRDRVINSPSGINHFFPQPTPRPVRATPVPATPVPATPVPYSPPPPPPLDSGCCL